MADKVKVGVIGVGQIGKRHVAGYAAMPNVEIVAVADLNQAEVERVAAEHGIGKMKVGRIASERYRSAVGKHTLIMRNVAGPHNLMHA